MVTYDAVKALWVISAALLIGAAWFAFFGTSATEKMQVTPDLTLPCVPSSTNLCGSGFGLSIDSTTKPGKSEPIVFACSTVWDRWVEKTGAQHDGTTYAALTGASSPETRWYGDSSAVLVSATAVCYNSEQGRLHIFWTLLAFAVLVAIASELVRRTIPFEADPDPHLMQSP